MTTRIIGVHSGHDASACLLIDNKIVGSIAKERLTRNKHAQGDPIECIEYLLKHFDFAPNDIDLVVRSDWHDARELNDAWYDRFPRVQKTQKHHLLHAYAASVVAAPGPSLILVCDGRGCRPKDNGELFTGSGLFEVESVFRHQEGRIIQLHKMYRPYKRNHYPWGSHIDSLGYAYSAVSKMIFGSSFAAGKVMALAALGSNTSEIPTPLLYGTNQPFAINPDWLAYLQGCPTPINWDTKLAADLAFSIQKGLEEYMAWRTNLLSQTHGVADFLLGGGVALNCKNNGLLANAPWTRTVDIFPAAGDDGLSVGAAVMALREVFGDYRPIAYQVSQGANYDFTPPQQVVAEATNRIAQLLIEGKTVGVFQGGAEFGPRALGYRSILSSATKLGFKTRLNTNIKRREGFRPFGGIVLRGRLNELTDDDLAGPYMLSAANLSKTARMQYPALAHVDGTVRLQVVEEDGDLLHQILASYERLSGHVALINTSFNGHDEPIVETLEHARKCAKAIGLDYMYAEGEVEKVYV